MRPDEWPHQFIKDGPEYKVNEDGRLGYPMICVHCGKKFRQYIDPRPTNACPARRDKRELSRIKR